MEVTRHNFADLLGEIEKLLRACCLVGFDAEFTSLPSNAAIRPRLFDDGAERYTRMRSEVSTAMMTQVGLTFYVYERESSLYRAHTYTFHLRPQAVGDIDQMFRFQASTLEFLRRVGFDFNKFIYDGIVFLNRVDAERLSSLRENGELAEVLFRGLEMEHERELQDSCSTVSKWLNSNSLELSQEERDTLYLDPNAPVLRYLLHTEIRSRFPHVLTTDSFGTTDKLLVYRNKDVAGARHKPLKEIEDRLMTELLGFSRVVELLAEHKKPIVGHNVFIDLILLHNQFLGPVPRSYSQFKKSIRQFAPELYDTKHIAASMSRSLTFDDVWKSTALMELYEFFSKDKCEKLRKCGATVLPVVPFQHHQTYHEAGWDSYCAGYLLLRLGAWAASDLSGRGGSVGPVQTLAALSQHRGRVNLMRCAVQHMNVGGEDPARNRPQLMHVRALKSPRIDIARVAALLSGYGTVDVQAYGSRAALVAAATHHTADKILGSFRSPEYRVSRYSVYRHSRAANVALWSGMLVTAGVVLMLVHKRLQS